MDFQKTQTMNKKAPRSTFSYKLISYIGADIEAKVDEHFRRSLGSRYNKTAATLSTKQADSNEETSNLNAKSSVGSSSSETKLVINELELEEIKHPQR